MSRRTERFTKGLFTVLALAVPLVLGAGSAQATTQYLGDGAVQNARGGWDLPLQGSCPADPTKLTRPECLALRLSGFADKASCEALVGGVQIRSWVIPTASSPTSGVCNDPANLNNEAGCNAQPDRLYNAATGVCAIVMLSDDRNDVVCAQHGGYWDPAGTCTGNWIMPATTAYTPNLLTGNGAGDQCLRCHNSRTQYNSARVRDTEDTLYMGHKNMARKVTVGTSWGGPPFACSNALYTTEEDCFNHGGTWDPTVYPSDDSGNVFHWNTGTATVNSVDRDMTWIYGDWLAPLPRAIYKTDPATTKVCLKPAYADQTSCQTAGFAWLGGVCEDPSKTQTTCTTGTWGTGPSGVCDDPAPLYSKYADCKAASKSWIQNAGASYSCGRCHTTGWTSDLAANAAKEPEKSFSGISWSRTADAGFGVVSLAGGVTGDSNKFSSWDVWGISCTRCHNSTIDDQYETCTGATVTNQTCTNNGGTWESRSLTCSITQAGCTAAGGTWALPYGAQVGMSSHHSNLTAPDRSTGTCTDPRWTAEAQCTAAGGTWLTACSLASTAGVCTQAVTTSGSCTGSGVWVLAPAPWCSNAFYTITGDCTANGFAWQDGWCTRPDQTVTTCFGGTGTSALTWRVNGTQPSCQVAGGTWSFSKCSVEGLCNKGSAYTTKTACDGVSGQFRYATDVIRCEDAGGRWTGNNSNRGQIITRLCMDCHRQETGGMPYANTTATAGTYATVNPGTYVKVGPAHGTVAPVSHPHGNQFLNGSHGKFTGTFNQITTGKFNWLFTGEYKSIFQDEAEAANTGNGCTGCHEVHTSTVAGEKPFREECTECHAGPYAKDLNAMLHPSGPSTPMENMDTEEAEACEICHMPEGMHLFRINTSGVYSTFPALALTDTVNANTSPAGFGTDEQFDNAVWVDVDHACGQCHGGGIARVGATGGINITTNAKLLNVTGVTDLSTGLPASFTAGNRIKIPGAGALEADGFTRGDFDTYVVSATSTTVTLAGSASGSVSGAAVTQNPTRTGVSYKTKSELAFRAQGIHSGVPAVPSYITFSHTVSGLTVNVNASDSTCSGSSDNCNAYTWNWGEGPNTTGVTSSHLYATGGSKTITLTVEEYGITGGTKTKNVTVAAPDTPPLVASTCSWNPNTWTMSLDDASSDDNGLKQVTVNWGDGTPISNDTTPATTPAFGPFSHTYLIAGTFSITHKAYDTIGQQATETACASTPAVPAYFAISGTVYAKGGAPLPSAFVLVKKGTTLVRVVATAPNGTFSAGSLKPGTYSLTVSKYGYTFAAAPQLSGIIVGPSSSGNIIIASGGLVVRQVLGSTE